MVVGDIQMMILAPRWAPQMLTCLAQDNYREVCLVLEGAADLFLPQNVHRENSHPVSEQWYPTHGYYLQVCQCCWSTAARITGTHIVIPSMAIIRGFATSVITLHAGLIHTIFDFIVHHGRLARVLPCIISFVFV